VCLLSGACAACRTEVSPAGQRSPAKANVILISIDTLRADHLSCYGYFRRTSPHLDRLAADSVLFERAYAQSPNTLISHATMLTSLNPISHGARPDRALDESITTLAELFRSHGFRTAGFTAHPTWLNRKMGFAQGFDYFLSGDRVAPGQLRQALYWLRSLKRQSAGGAEEPFFLFVHLYDVHSDFKKRPYHTGTPFDRLFTGFYEGRFRGCRAGRCASQFLLLANEHHELLSEDELKWIIALYDGSVAYVDHHLGVFFGELRQLGLMEDTWVVVTSDHGEEFREHGQLLHSQPYEETARVPLIVRPPGGGFARRIAAPVGLVDLLPTLAEAVGIEPEGPIEGRSLLPLIRGTAMEQSPPVFWTGYDPTDIAVRTGEYTLDSWGKRGSVELYEYGADPGQRVNVARSHRRVTQSLRRTVDGFEKDQTKKSVKRLARKVIPTREDIQRLKALGYVE
jgi:arylsulfatase A-like enzyme